MNAIESPKNSRSDFLSGQNQKKDLLVFHFDHFPSPQFTNSTSCNHKKRTEILTADTAMNSPDNFTSFTSSNLQKRGDIKPTISQTMSALPETKKKPHILEYNSALRKVGTLKFYNEPKKFGFLLEDDSGKDIFFHLKDMEDGGVEEKLLMENKSLKFSYVGMKYNGKKPDSKKAVEIKLCNE